MAPKVKELMKRKPNESNEGIAFRYKDGINKATDCIKESNLNYYYNKNRDKLDNNRTKEIKHKE